MFVDTKIFLQSVYKITDFGQRLPNPNIQLSNGHSNHKHRLILGRELSPVLQQLPTKKSTQSGEDSGHNVIQHHTQASFDIPVEPPNGARL